MYTSYIQYMHISAVFCVHRYTLHSITVEFTVYFKKKPSFTFTPPLRKRLPLSANTNRMLPVFPLYSLSVAGSILPVLG